MISHVRMMLEFRAMERRVEDVEHFDDVECSCPHHVQQEPQTPHGPSTEAQHLGVFQHVASPGPSQT